MNDAQSRIEVLRPRAGDTLVVSVAERLSKQQYEQIHGWISPALPRGVKVLILDKSISLAHIVNPTPAAEAQAQPEPFDFDAWMRDRTEHAHRDFMHRTSCLPAGRDLRPTTEQVARYHCAAIGFID